MDYTIVKISDLPKGSFFRKLRKGAPCGDHMTRQGYCRTERKFECHYESDISKNCYLKGKTEVAVGETY